METGLWAYTEKVKEHFQNPKNILQNREEVDRFDGKGIEGNMKCGDEMLMVINVDKDKQIVTECKWLTYGCASAIASTSILSEMVIGMSLDKAYKISPKDVAKELGGLPENKIHCSVLGDKALRAAIDDYYQKNGMEGKIVKKDEKVICECLNITDHDIEDAVLEGARTYEELQERTKIGTVCGECREESIEVMEGFIKKHFD